MRLEEEIQSDNCLLNPSLCCRGMPRPVTKHFGGSLVRRFRCAVEHPSLILQGKHRGEGKKRELFSAGRGAYSSDLQSRSSCGEGNRLLNVCATAVYPLKSCNVTGAIPSGVEGHMLFHQEELGRCSSTSAGGLS